uniref:Early nodulin-93 n=1 Tax=Aegilops tauschii subsp. strangulata TaxID=200361 RepID=A0A453QTX0_AEGTS
NPAPPSEVPRGGKTISHSLFQFHHQAVLLGGKNAAIAGTVVAVPTFVACRVLPWAKHNLNYTAQALIISTACVAGFFITADKTILRNARQNTIGRIDEST